MIPGIPKLLLKFVGSANPVYENLRQSDHRQIFSALHRKPVSRQSFVTCPQKSSHSGLQERCIIHAISRHHRHIGRGKRMDWNSLAARKRVVLGVSLAEASLAGTWRAHAGPKTFAIGSASEPYPVILCSYGTNPAQRAWGGPRARVHPVQA